MKKTKSMRVAVLMLALTLITSCFVGGTFAKYTTSGAAKDSARVAKFGVKVTADGSTFAKEYDAKDPTIEDYNGDAILKSVVSSDDSKVVAPGTSGNMVFATISGTPEVAVAVKYEATVTLNDKWMAKANADAAAEEFYCPIIITVGEGDKEVKIYQGAEIDGTAINSKTAFETAVKNAIESYTENYKPGTDLSDTTKVKAPVVSWEWEFEGDDVLGTGVATVPGQTDYKDTYLGDAAANDVANAGKIDVTVGITVTQID